MNWPKVKIEASAETRKLNAAIERLDILTHYIYHEVTDLVRLEEIAMLRGWTNIAATVRRHAGKAKL